MKKAMTKVRLITEVSKETGLSKTDTANALEGVLDSIKRELQQGNKIKIMRLGTFKTFQLKARDGYNPRTGEAMKIPEKVIIRFRAGAKLKEEVA
ncbi:MAG: HU family DNA-binding protein [Bacteriovorax sp.]|jgi:DNA-binding protein HU-beta|nr:HU family DNA-binding protein [Bacteriovorax sp.]